MDGQEELRQAIINFRASWARMKQAVRSLWQTIITFGANHDDA